MLLPGTPCQRVLSTAQALPEQIRRSGSSAGPGRCHRQSAREDAFKGTVIIKREGGDWEADAGCFLIICRSQLQKRYLCDVKVKG